MLRVCKRCRGHSNNQVPNSPIEIKKKKNGHRAFFAAFFFSHTRFKSCSWLSSFSYLEYRKRLLLLIIPWFAVGMAAYGIHFSVKWVHYHLNRRQCEKCFCHIISSRFVQFNIFIVSAIKDTAIIVAVFLMALIYDKVR